MHLLVSVPKPATAAAAQLARDGGATDSTHTRTRRRQERGR